MANRNFEYYPTSTPNVATNIFNNNTSNNITVIVAEKEPFSNNFTTVDAFIPTNNNYWKFLNYTKESDVDTIGSNLNTMQYLNGGLDVYVYADSTQTTHLTGQSSSAPGVYEGSPEEISRYFIYVKESTVETDIYNITTISIPNYIIDAQGNITVGTPTTQTIKTLKPLASITNLLPIQFA